MYINVNGYEEENKINVDSPDILLRVTGQVAELKLMFVMTEPYTPLGETLTCEANVTGIEKSKNLNLEFWADNPSSKFEKIANIKTKELSPGEEAIYSTEITPKERYLQNIQTSL